MDYTRTKQGLFWGLLTKDRNRLNEPVEVKTCIYGVRYSTSKIDLYKDGTLVLHHGYAWDGASGPTIDTEETMRASAVHDALYLLINLGAISKEVKWRADMMLYKFMRADGANRFRAFCWLFAVEVFGSSHL